MSNKEKTTTETAEAAEATETERIPKGQSVNARAKASLRAIVELLSANQKVGVEILKTAADLVAEFPLASVGSGLPLPEQLAAVEEQISKVFLSPDSVVDGKIVRNEDKEEQLRILLDRKRRIKTAIGRDKKQPKAEVASA